MRVPPGTYNVGANLSSDDQWYSTYRTITVDADKVLDVEPVTTDLRVHVLDGSTPTSRTVELQCMADQGNTSLTTRAVGDDVTLAGVPDPEWGHPPPKCLRRGRDDGTAGLPQHAVSGADGRARSSSTVRSSTVTRRTRSTPTAWTPRLRLWGRAVGTATRTVSTTTSKTT